MPPTRSASRVVSEAGLTGQSGWNLSSKGRFTAIPGRAVRPPPAPSAVSQANDYQERGYAVGDAGQGNAEDREDNRDEHRWRLRRRGTPGRAAGLRGRLPPLRLAG